MFKVALLEMKKVYGNKVHGKGRGSIIYSLFTYTLSHDKKK